VKRSNFSNQTYDINLMPFLMISFMLIHLDAVSQDTFSIVAVDTITGEVGSAGASCLEIDHSRYQRTDFISQLIPGKGAINTQAYYHPVNQMTATTRLINGDSPEEVVSWMQENDIANRADLRQYGVVAIIDGRPEAAAYTGSNTNNYHGQIIGRNYAIQGNILSGSEVLESMETHFLNQPGSLSCKLMAALQGAKSIGADTRCFANGSSSLFAFLSVSLPNDSFGYPSISFSVNTKFGERIEPIDSLQHLFDLQYTCPSANH